MLRTAMNILLIATLFTFCSDTFAWQDSEAEVTRQTEPAIGTDAASPILYTAKQERGFGGCRANGGRQITSYQAVELWRGYCQENCFYQQHGHCACAGACLAGCSRSVCHVPRARCGRVVPSRRACRNLGCDR